jgi:hypothetical protein
MCRQNQQQQSKTRQYRAQTKDYEHGVVLEIVAGLWGGVPGIEEFRDRKQKRRDK